MGRVKLSHRNASEAVPAAFLVISFFEARTIFADGFATSQIRIGILTTGARASSGVGNKDTIE